MKNTNIALIPIPDENEDVASNFNEKDISEKETANSISVLNVLHKSFIPVINKRPFSSKNILQQFQRKNSFRRGNV